MIVYLLVIVLIYTALSVQGFPHFANDPGVGWHLKNGEYILQNGIPSADPFLSISRPWISDQWLSDVILYIAQRDLAWEGAYLILTALFMCCFVVVLFKSTIKFETYGEVKTPSTALGVSLALILCARIAMMHFIFRPVIFSFFLFSFVFWFFLRIFDCSNVKKSDYVWFVAIFCLWANIHPSFVLGLALIGIGIITVLVGKFFISSGSNPGCAQLVVPSSLTLKLLLLFILCLVATMLNPYGYNLHQSILKLGGSEYFMKLNNEWLPLSVITPEGQVTSLVVASLVVWFLISARVSSNIVFSVGAILFFLYQSLVSIRFLPYFAIVSLPLLATALSDLHRRFLPVGLFQFTGKESKLFYCMFVVITGIFISTNILIGFRGSNIGIPSMQLAVDAISKGSSSPNTFIYNHPNFGGRLTYFCGEICKPILDDRNTLLGEEVYKEFLGIKTWDEARNLLVKNNAKFLLSKDKNIPVGANPLKLIFTGEDFKVFSMD